VKKIKAANDTTKGKVFNRFNNFRKTNHNKAKIKKLMLCMMTEIMLAHVAIAVMCQNPCTVYITYPFYETTAYLLQRVVRTPHD